VALDKQLDLVSFQAWALKASLDLFLIIKYIILLLFLPQVNPSSTEGSSLQISNPQSPFIPHPKQ